MIWTLLSFKWNSLPISSLQRGGIARQLKEAFKTPLPIFSWIKILLECCPASQSQCNPWSHGFNHHLPHLPPNLTWEIQDCISNCQLYIQFESFKFNTLSFFPNTFLLLYLLSCRMWLLSIYWINTKRAAFSKLLQKHSCLVRYTVFWGKRVLYSNSLKIRLNWISQVLTMLSSLQISKKWT